MCLIIISFGNTKHLSQRVLEKSDLSAAKVIIEIYVFRSDPGHELYYLK